MRILAGLCAAGLAIGAALGAAPSATSQQGATVAELRTQLDAAGERRDQAAEAYDAARIRRTDLDAKLGAARTDLARSEARLSGERKKLGTAARNLYMHPAAGLGTFFQAKSYGQLERASAFAGHVFLSTDDLILRVRKARAEERSSASALQTLRDQARAEELHMNRERIAAQEAIDKTRSLLASANGALARLIEAERRAGLADAASYAATHIKFAGAVRPSAQAAVQFAAAQIGKPYQYGGEGPNAYDCSGLTMRAWGAAGVGLPHNAAAQYSMLPKVPMSQLAPGDLVFRGSGPSHVGIYEGGGKVIHAPHTGTVIQETSVSGFETAARP